MAATALAAVKVAPYVDARRRAAAEIGGIVLVSQLALWTRGTLRLAALAALAGFMLPEIIRAYPGRAVYAESREQGSGRLLAVLKSLGRVFRHLTGFGWFDWGFPALAAYAAFGLGLLAHVAGTLHRDVYYEPLERLVAAKAMYVVSAMVQWLVLRNFAFPRLGTLLASRDGSVHGTAAYFASCHLPNVPLAVLCYVFGYVGLARCERYNGVLSVGLAHAFLGIALSWCVPQQVICLHVGQGYLRHAHKTYVDPIYGDRMPPNRSGWRPQPTPSWLR